MDGGEIHITLHWCNGEFFVRINGTRKLINSNTNKTNDLLQVAEVNYILTKGKGVFCNVSSSKAKAKLRLLYEVSSVACTYHVETQCANEEKLSAPLSPSSSRKLGVPRCTTKRKRVDKQCMNKCIEAILLREKHNFGQP